MDFDWHVWMLKQTLLSFVLLLWGTEVLLADLIVHVSDATLAVGGSGYVDVYVKSSSGEGLTSLELTFDIGNTTYGDLKFSTAQNDSERTATNYVFGNDVGPGGFASFPTDHQLKQFDSTDSNSDAMLTAGTDYLLARLELGHTTNNPLNAVGQTFQVLLRADAEFLGSNPLIIVQNQVVDVDGVSYYQNLDLSFGTVTISAVPEPSSLVLLGAASAVGVILRRRLTPSRRRQRVP